MNVSEERVIRQVIERLECKPRADGSPGVSKHVHDALTGPAKLYLDTWVIGALRHLLPESRDLKLAVDLSRP